MADEEQPLISTLADAVNILTAANVGLAAALAALNDSPELDVPLDMRRAKDSLSRGFNALNEETGLLRRTLQIIANDEPLAPLPDDPEDPLFLPNGSPYARDAGPLSPRQLVFMAKRVRMLPPGTPVITYRQLLVDRGLPLPAGANWPAPVPGVDAPDDILTRDPRMCIDAYNRAMRRIDGDDVGVTAWLEAIAGTTCPRCSAAPDELCVSTGRNIYEFPLSHAPRLTAAGVIVGWATAAT